VDRDRFCIPYGLKVFESGLDRVLDADVAELDDRVRED